MTKKHSSITYILILIIIGTVIFGKSVFNGFIGDDYSQILDNLLIHDTKNVPSFFTTNIFYYDGNPQLSPPYFKPLLYTAFSFIYSVFSTNAFGYHAIQLLFFITNACLVYFLFKFFFKNTTAFVFSLLFLIHPINTEVAFYISDLQDVLYFFFGSLAFLILQYFQNKKALVGAGVLLLLSLFSKETGILFVLLSSLFVLWYRKAFVKPFIIVVFLVCCIYGALRFYAIGVNTPYLVHSPITTISFWERMISMPMIFLFYLKQFIFPLNLSVSYMWIIKSITILEFVLPLILDLVFILAVFFEVRHITKQKRNLSTFIFFALWFFIGMLLHMQFIPLDKTVSERWFYFPIVGLLGMIAVVFESHQWKWSNPIVIVLLFIIIAAFTVRDTIRVADWKDDLTLSLHDLQVSKEAFDLEDQLSFNYFNQERYDLVKLHALRSIEIYPTVFNYTNLGTGYFLLKDYKNAKQSYTKALTYGDYDVTYNDLSALAIYYGDPKENIHFIQSVSLKKFPRNASLWFNLARLEYKAGMKKEAKQHIQRAYNLNDTPLYRVYYLRMMNDLSIRE